MPITRHLLVRFHPCVHTFSCTLSQLTSVKISLVLFVVSHTITLIPSQQIRRFHHLLAHFVVFAFKAITPIMAPATEFREIRHMTGPE